MELIELYEQIKNPIDNPIVIQKLVNAYANGMNKNSGFYKNMLSTVEKEYTKGEHYPFDYDIFYSMLFNKWKNSIINLSEEEFIQLYKNGSFGKDFIKLRRYLKTVNDAITKEDADRVLYVGHEDKELQKAIDKYSWDISYDYWVHVCSRYLTAKKDEFPDIKHRLYINTESVHIHKIAKLFIDKCDEKQLPYYFKFDPYSRRDDSFVIYSSDDKLMKYIEVLREIRQEHSELMSVVKEPPILTGNIDGWIGYGSQPEKIDGKDVSSFNSLRAELIESVIDDVTKDWVVNHLDSKVNSAGQILQEYISIIATKKIFANFEKYYQDQVELEKKKAQAEGNEFDYLSVDIKTGYSLVDLKSKIFKNTIFSEINDNICELTKKVCNGSYQIFDSIELFLRNGRHVLFTGSDLKVIIRELASEIAKNDSDYIRTIQTEIKKRSKKYGIDGDKFCFDSKKINDVKPINKEEDSDLFVIDTNDFIESKVETIEDYNDMKSEIKSYGNIKEILKNHDLVMTIIAHNGDRDFFKVFIDLVNEGLENKIINQNDLELFTSGEIVNAIVNLDNTTQEYSKRDSYPEELKDKLIQLSHIKDDYSYAASFTNSKILNALKNEENSDLIEWSKKKHNPPVGGFATVISSLLEAGKIEIAKRFIDLIAGDSKKYIQNDGYKQSLLDMKSKLETFEAQREERNKTR